jgi:hypothetical protein
MSIVFSDWKRLRTVAQAAVFLAALVGCGGSPQSVDPGAALPSNRFPQNRTSARKATETARGPNQRGGPGGP